MIASVAASCAVDVAVLGAGPAGIGAAVSAGAAGRSVLLIDEAPAAGGQIYRKVPDSLLPARHGAGDDVALRDLGADSDMLISSNPHDAPDLGAGERQHVLRFTNHPLHRRRA